MDERVKQVIILRSKFPDRKGEFRKLRTGKYVAQGAHASQMALKEFEDIYSVDILNNKEPFHPWKSMFDVWHNETMTKIVLYVETEEEILELAKIVENMKIPFSLIKDRGLTEFNNEVMITALGIGPWIASKIDEITKNLPLF